MVITDSTINNEVWSAVKTRIVTGLALDVISASVVPSYTGRKLSKPIVVIPPLEKGKGVLKFGDSSGRYDITVNIFVVANNTDDVDTISQAVENYLEEDDIDGIAYLSHITSYDFSQVNDAPYHTKSISVSYVRE